MIDIQNEKGRIIKIIGKIEESIRFGTEMFNERYLHHFFSHQWQKLYEREMGKEFNLLESTDKLIFHPEWPTHKKGRAKNYGKYRKLNKKYEPARDGSPGFIDFAIGDYNEPWIGIEMTLKYGWDKEEIIYDFLKLLDSANPFKVAFSINVLVRKNNLSEGKFRDNFRKKLKDVFSEAMRRLTLINRNSELGEKHFIFFEVAGSMVRRWELRGEIFEEIEN